MVAGINILSCVEVGVPLLSLMSTTWGESVTVSENLLEKCEITGQSFCLIYTQFKFWSLNFV